VDGYHRKYRSKTSCESPFEILLHSVLHPAAAPGPSPESSSFWAFLINVRRVRFKLGTQSVAIKKEHKGPAEEAG